MTQTSTGAAPLRAGVLCAGLAGAAGVATLAAAAHMDTTGLMQQAGQMMLFHAPALAVAGLLATLRRAPLATLALGLMTLGLLLFCGDMLSRALAEDRLFPMAAPGGGIALILSWITLGLAGLFSRAR
ncbi:DUF423 domain-containing protein [Roseibium aestuarii]|uniref:DUF423 domain-containing protein n=1 Tax=Roseibium aestuarii TaxID=2600299 RepID=A0ABW4JRA9_9HYPH|nr:DUF423 domain-containing protein [Roseibium aestuarii]